MQPQVLVWVWHLWFGKVGGLLKRVFYFFGDEPKLSRKTPILHLTLGFTQLQSAAVPASQKQVSVLDRLISDCKHLKRPVCTICSICRGIQNISVLLSDVKVCAKEQMCNRMVTVCDHSIYQLSAINVPVLQNFLKADNIGMIFQKQVLTFSFSFYRERSKLNPFTCMA